MDISRKGESLWSEWTGVGGSAKLTYACVLYYTVGHIDLENEVVRRALASAIQRDGVADGLGQAYRAINDWTMLQGWAGEVDGSYELFACDQSGETEYGEAVDEVQPITWVEVSTLA